ncbi:MAG: hypothetical protein AVDCRST_MAG19-1570 [uncultured Thermomicrobiales bacterium]|uniref:Uncharacterized protein n=1 Tax=uncultured Thermomicrobiales bacterium TaxID=1645740 RepID=A0A6J4U5X0_9BACT|nr:MAG: hypothetical protein AVDCRST_MAG19-1570 [uncultured Thermomicrobiales bacterium]
MRHLRSVSVLLFLAGLVLLLGSLLLSLSPTWTLIGLLLAWAGLVKVVVVRLWRGIAPRAGLDGGGDD